MYASTSHTCQLKCTSVNKIYLINLRITLVPDAVAKKQ